MTLHSNRRRSKVLPKLLQRIGLKKKISKRAVFSLLLSYWKLIRICSKQKQSHGHCSYSWNILKMRNVSKVIRIQNTNIGNELSSSIFILFAIVVVLLVFYWQWNAPSSINCWTINRDCWHYFWNCKQHRIRKSTSCSSSLNMCAIYDAYPAIF